MLPLFLWRFIMLIANTIDQKFLQAILAEQQKTNELLGQLLCLMRKDKEERPDDKPKRGNKNVSQPHSTSGRRANSGNSSGNGAKRSGKRQTVPDLEHGSTAALLQPDNDGNGGKRNASSGRKRVPGKANSKG